MNFVYLEGGRTRALKLARRLARGSLLPENPVRLLGHTITSEPLLTVNVCIAREGAQRTIFTQSDEHDMLLRLAW